MIKILTIILFLSVFNKLSATSLWIKSTNNERGLYGDKGLFGGDLITIDVGESSSLTQPLKIQ